MFVEHAGGEPDRLSLEALTFARGLAATLGGALERSLLGSGGPPSPARLGGAGRRAGARGDRPRLDDYAPAAWGAAIRAASASAAPQPVVVAGQRARQRGARPRGGAHGTADGRERHRGHARRSVAARPPALGRQPARGRGARRADSAARRGAARRRGRRRRAAGPAPARHSVRAGAGARGPRRAGRRARGAQDGRRSRSATPRSSSAAGAASAPRRASRELEELAGLLGGAVGGSRVVTSLGWRPHSGPDRPDRAADRAGPLHRLRHQRRDPAHRRLQGGEADPRDQHGPRGADHGRRRLRRDRRPPTIVPAITAEIRRAGR